MDELADSISLLNVALLVYLIVTKKFSVLLGVFLIMLLIDVIKNIIREPRPTDSINCNLLNTGGVSETFGMPSGHVAIITTILILLDAHPAIIIPFVGLMIWSRVHKKCHTLSQSIAGAIFGVLFSLIFNLTSIK